MPTIGVLWLEGKESGELGMTTYVLTFHLMIFMAIQRTEKVGRKGGVGLGERETEASEFETLLGRGCCGVHVSTCTISA